MELKLTDAEARVLAQLLEGDIARLLLEIAHTDNRHMREGLKAREELIKGIRDRLAAVV